MFPVRLAALLGDPSLRDVSRLDESHLQALVAAQVGEDQDLDFKRARYDHGPKGTFELAKDVAALANQVGGLLILGIEEDQQGRAKLLAPVKLEDSEKGRIRQVIAERIFPMPAGVQVHDVPVAGDSSRGCYLVAVPRSLEAPHAVRELKPKPLWFCYPVRHGTTTHFLSETEVASRYRDRFALARGQIDRLAQVHAQGRGAESPGVLAIAIGLVPALPGDRPLTGVGPKIQDFLSSWKSRWSSLEGSTFGNYGVARRRLRAENGSARLELHSDGAGWIRYVVGSGSGDVVLVPLGDLEMISVEMIALLAGFAGWTGAAGDCAISAQVFGVSGSRLRLRRSLPSSDVVDVTALPAEPAETTAPLGQLLDDRKQVGQAAYLLLRDLEQDMGIPEPDALRNDGAIRQNV